MAGKGVWSNTGVHRTPRGERGEPEAFALMSGRVKKKRGGSRSQRIIPGGDRFLLDSEKERRNSKLSQRKNP